MGFVSTGGITKLSQLVIDADKDWATKGISNLKELALGMINGDVIARGAGGVLVRIPASTPNLVFTSAGLGLLPFWAPGGLYLNRYFPASMYLWQSVAKNTVRDHTHPESGPITSVHVDELGNDPANMVSMSAPAITAPRTAVLNTARTYLQPETGPLHTHFDLQGVVEGGVEAPVAGDTDDTGHAQSAAANDMSLPPQTAHPGGLNDAYDFGHSFQFDVLRLVLGTQGVGVWTVTWKYWNGAWTNLAGVVDGTNHFMAVAGTYEVSFTRPGDWQLLNIAGLNLFWIRAEITAYTSKVTQPLGTQAFVRIIT